MLTSLCAIGWLRTGTMPQRADIGLSWLESYTGGTSALPLHCQGANRGLQGLQFAGPIPAACRFADSRRPRPTPRANSVIQQIT